MPRERCVSYFLPKRGRDLEPVLYRIETALDNLILLGWLSTFAFLGESLSVEQKLDRHCMIQHFLNLKNRVTQNSTAAAKKSWQDKGVSTGREHPFVLLLEMTAHTMIPLLFLVDALWIGDRKSTWNYESHHLTFVAHYVRSCLSSGEEMTCHKLEH